MYCQPAFKLFFCLVVQACAFLNTYKELRGDCQVWSLIYLWFGLVLRILIRPHVSKY